MDVESLDVLVMDRFILRAILSHVSIPPNQSYTTAKDELMRRENEGAANAHVTSLAQVGRGVLIGQSARWLLAFAGEKRPIARVQG